MMMLNKEKVKVCLMDEENIIRCNDIYFRDEDDVKEKVERLSGVE